MVALILVGLTLARAGMFSLYAVLIVYFLPGGIWRQLGPRARK